MWKQQVENKLSYKKTKADIDDKKQSLTGTKREILQDVCAESDGVRRTVMRHGR